MILDFLAKTIKPIETRQKSDVLLAVFEQMLSESIKQAKPLKQGTGPNRGDMSEGVVGAALVAAFLKPNKLIDIADIVEVLETLNSSQPIPQKGKKTVTREHVYQHEHVSVRFGLCLAKVNFDGLATITTNQQMSGYLTAATAYANSRQIRKAVEMAYANTAMPQVVSVLAGGFGRPHRSKCDIVVTHNDQVIPWGNVTLKCDTTKQLAMVSRNFDQNSFTSQSRGIRNLVESVLGVDVGSDTLQEKYDLAVKGCNKEALLEAVEVTYETAAKLFNSKVQSSGNLPVFQRLATGIRQEALGNELDLIQIRLDESGTYTYMDYHNLVWLSKYIDSKDVVLSAVYKPGSRDTSQPYLYVQAIVNGINFGNLISLRPKIRHHENGKIKEFKHYLQNEPGLELLASYAAKNPNVASLCGS